MLGQGRAAEALAIAKEICQLAPDVPMSHANVAMIREGLDESDDGVEAGFRRALELDGDYLFARAGLARVLARRGDADAASAMLSPALLRKEYHYSEWRTILLAQRAIALLQQSRDALDAIDASLRELEDIART